MKKTRTTMVLCSVLVLAMVLSGCQIGNKDIVVSGSANSRQVFEIEDCACSIKEARVYLTNYQNIYGTAYGIDLWQHDFGDDSLVDYVKAVTMDELTRVYCMELLAESREMTLTEEEQRKTTEAAEEYYASLSKEECAYLDVSEKEIGEYYARYALAQKLYNSLTNEVNVEVSDDEARVMEIMQIFVADSARAAEVSSRLSNGDDFASVANNYNELSVIQTMITRDDVPPEVEEVAFALDNDQISGMITVENGYYFIKCLNKYHEELTEANKANIVEKREKELFDDVYTEYVSSLSSSVNEEVWNAIELNTDGTIKTDCFFEIFLKHCGEIL